MPTSISFATGASRRSRSGEVGAGRCGWTTSAPVAPMPRVSPSGGAFARAARPVVPPADDVLHHDGLAQALAEVHGNRPRYPVGRSARRERDDHADGLLR